MVAADVDGTLRVLRPDGSLVGAAGVDPEAGHAAAVETSQAIGDLDEADGTTALVDELPVDDNGHELTGWAAAVDRNGGASVARSVSLSSVARVRRLDLYHSAMPGRQADNGAVGFPTELQSSGGSTVPAGISASPEYIARALDRCPG